MLDIQSDHFLNLRYGLLLAQQHYEEVPAEENNQESTMEYTLAQRRYGEKIVYLNQLDEETEMVRETLRQELIQRRIHTEELLQMENIELHERLSRTTGRDIKV
jgi:hypothetical protein